MTMKQTQHEQTNAFIEACQQKITLANICMNWLRVSSNILVEAVHTESGCMRSTRLAMLKPVTHEVTADSALQLVVLPAAFDDLRHRGYEHQRWQLMVYSWLGPEDTQRLISHLCSKVEGLSARFFLVKGGECALTPLTSHPSPLTSHP